MSDVTAINNLVAKHKELKQEIAKIIVGQDAVIDQILLSIYTGGHSLLIGVPGLAKTLMVNTIAQTLGLDFKRIQFTPDLMPSDILGSEVLDQNRSFKFIKGPIFSNIILADEINRTPPKTQAALLEAMQERSVTIAGKQHKLELPYFVLATQNPIEQEGTYPLPEAQMDRFLIHVRIGYPDADAERAILRLNRQESKERHEGTSPAKLAVSQETIFAARQEVLAMHMADELEDYILNIVLATRDARAYGEDIARAIQYGASPRATIALDRCARARAWLDGRDFVSPDDVQAMAPDVLRHRIILNFEAEAEGITTDDMIQAILQRVGVP